MNVVFAGSANISTIQATYSTMYEDRQRNLQNVKTLSNLNLSCSRFSYTFLVVFVYIEV